MFRDYRVWSIKVHRTPNIPILHKKNAPHGPKQSTQVKNSSSRSSTNKTIISNKTPSDGLHSGPNTRP